MNHYDPSKTPNPDVWLEMDEQKRIGLIAAFHQEARVALPNPTIHAAMHAIIENQLAEGLEVPCQALSRLMQEGLERHDAVHAMASVVADHLFDLLNVGSPDGSENERYYETLRRLTAAKWLKLADQE